ncbi:LysM peptidoglycan-binding domain-containing protein [Desulfococcus sp.]|uniref:LysM peptidoglycan-binding domain-containing protein n=1 Tax=Desulfococcus sp. TaxID=2025834 RepID=UPI003594652E
MIERHAPHTAAPGAPDTYNRAPVDSIDGLPGKDASTHDPGTRKSPSDEKPKENSKQRSIPSLEARLAKVGIDGAHVIHLVQAGETLSEIAKARYGTSRKDLLQTLKKVNEIQETDTVQAGWELILPAMTIDGEVRPKSGMEASLPPDQRLEPGAGAPRPSDGGGDDASAVSIPPPEDDGRTAEGPAFSRFQEGVFAFKREDYPAAYDAFAFESGSDQRCDPCAPYLKEIKTRAGLHFEKGLGLFRQRSYAKAIQEFEKARIPPNHSQTAEYLFKSHFEIALKKFLKYKRSGDRSLYIQARTSLNQARQYRAECPGCTDYEEAFKKTHYNNGIKYFTGNDGDSMDNALKEWEKVRFIDPGYKDVSENILQAEALLKKLKKFKKVS